MEAGLALVLGALVFVVAVLYSSVGHGGGSGYLAVMALLGVAPPEMRPAALVLNVLVAGIGAVKFYRAGRFSWATFWPFAALSVPCAILGGALTLPGALYGPLVGLALLYVAYRLLRQSGKAAPIGGAAVPRGVALAVGAGARERRRARYAAARRLRKEAARCCVCSCPESA